MSLFVGGPIQRVFAPQARRIKLKVDQVTVREPTLHLKDHPQPSVLGVRAPPSNMELLRQVYQVLSSPDCTTEETELAESLLMTVADLDHSPEELNLFVLSCNILACKLHTAFTHAGGQEQVSHASRKKWFFVGLAEEQHSRCDFDVQVVFLQNYGSILIDSEKYEAAEASLTRLIELLRQRNLSSQSSAEAVHKWRVAMIRVLSSRITALILLGKKGWQKQGVHDLEEMEYLVLAFREQMNQHCDLGYKDSQRKIGFWNKFQVRPSTHLQQSECADLEGAISRVSFLNPGQNVF